MRILIISHCEICYNPRLLKAGDFLKSKNHEIILFNPLTGIAQKEVYENCIKKRDWEIFEVNIKKDSLKSKITWVIVSILNAIIKNLWKFFRIRFGHKYFFNKGLLFFPYKKIKNIDCILIHVVDSLPFAVKLKKKYNAKLIYDSQEYFKGQYSNYPKNEYDWVCTFEKKYISDVDVLIATTYAMGQKIIKDYDLKIPVIRVRNLPCKRNIQVPITNNQSPSLKLIWHGMVIIPNNRRGVHIIIKALSLCKYDIRLTLQGLISKQQKDILDGLIKEYNVADKVTLIPPADPDLIIESLLNYDIGVIGELPAEENQVLTSSNKLFEYISAGLGVIAPDITGINETTDEYKIAYKYPTGDYHKLAEAIDHLAANPDELNKMKKASIEAFNNDLFWEKDYEKVLPIINL